MPPIVSGIAGTVPATRTKLRGGSYSVLIGIGGWGLQVLTTSRELATGGKRQYPLRFYMKARIVL